MISIKIQKLKLFGYHGLYKEEAIIGGEFEINLYVDYEENGIVNKVEHTLNYVNLVELIKKEFKKRYDLLETLAQQIAINVYNENTFIKNINISIVKLNAPINNFTGTVGVEYSKTF
jgi:7,8-dihydroneopterin aldolase/epimerase/oxygenase